ncbi:MAG: cupin domain-containing protein [Acidobacteria bacterium]|nr:cupin domain-containing protein [Acidobacteriota bacterium]
MELTRRKACLSLALLSQVSAWASQLPSLKSKTYRFEDLAVQKEKEAAYRDILEGRTHTGDYLEAHETVLEPNAMPHPPHRHAGEELFVISSGTLEVTIAGKPATLGPGSAFFIASNEEHSIRNIGSGPAQYFGITLGEKA